MASPSLILDFGGVILNIDYRITAQAFKKLGVKNFDEAYSRKEQTEFFNQLEEGKLSEDDFYEGIRRLSGLPLSDEEIREAWNAMLISLPAGNMEMLEKLSATHRIFLLSNTNIIHEKRFNRIVERDYGLDKFKSLFKKIYFSHRVGMRKPDEEIFRLILDEQGMDPKETLFVDDSPQHIAGAEKLGIPAALIETNSGLFQLRIHD